MQPSSADFRETKGQILFRLEKWNEAIAELEMALKAHYTSTEIHRSLAPQAVYSSGPRRELLEQDNLAVQRDSRR